MKVKRRSQTWNVIVPIAERPINGSQFTHYRIAGEVNAPTYDLAIEEAKPIAKPHLEKFRKEAMDGCTLCTRYDEGGKIYRVEEVEIRKGTKMEKWA